MSDGEIIWGKKKIDRFRGMEADTQAENLYFGTPGW